jgi:hypothetical protein
MNAIKATVRDGQIELDAPLDLPDGTELLIPLPNGTPGDNGDDEKGWNNSPEGIAEWLRWYDSLEPLIFTAEEEADTEAWLKKMNDYSGVNRDKGIEELFR